MTSPEDDGLEEELRQALSEAANEVEPAPDGLDKIRARIAGRPPRPWLRSVLFGVVERVRNWTWRGHWAWPDWLSRRAEVRWPHLRRGRFPGRGVGPLRLAPVLAAVAVIASITLGVQPFRHAILQAKSDLQGGNGPQQATAGTEGNGTRSVEAGGGAPSAGGTMAAGGRTGTGSVPSATETPGAAKPHSSPAAKCKSTPSSVVAAVQPNLTDVRPTSSAIAVAAPGVASTVTPATVAAVQPVYTDKSVVTCPVASPAKSPTPTPTSTPAAAPTDTSPAPTGSEPTDGNPAGSDATLWSPTPTAVPSPSRYGGPHSPARSYQYGQDKRPHRSRYGYGG